MTSFRQRRRRVLLATAAALGTAYGATLGVPALADTPVLVVTGKVEAVPAMRELVGDDSVFVKPFAVAQLLERVGELTGGGPGAGGRP